MTVKEIRKQYYHKRVRPETHELFVSNRDSMLWLIAFHAVDTKGRSLAQFVKEVATKEEDELFFKRVKTNFFHDGPTGFVTKASNDDPKQSGDKAKVV
jgi:hypothetical protein